MKKSKIERLWISTLGLLTAVSVLVSCTADNPTNLPKEDSSVSDSFYSENASTDETTAVNESADSDIPSAPTPDFFADPNANDAPSVQKKLSLSDKKKISDDALARLPETDLNGSNVIIVSSSRDSVIPEDTESIVSRAKYERLNFLEEKFNFKFAVRYANGNTIYNEAADSHKSGLYYADLIYVPDTSLYRYRAGGMALNINSLPFVSLSEPYFNQKCNDNASLGNKAYAAIGASNINYDNLAGIFFNKSLMSQITQDNIYSCVYDKSWTLDKLTELSKSASSDDTGKASGIFGLSTDLARDSLIENFYYSANHVNVDAGFGKVPVYSEFDDFAQSCADKIYTLMYGQTGYKNSNDALTLFADDKTLFYAGTLSAKNELPVSMTEWGILPFPLLSSDSGDSYRSFAGDGFPVTVVLSDTPDLSRSGLLLEAVNAAMYGYVEEKYFEDCMYYTVRDNDTLNMIEIIGDSASCDFSHMFAGSVKNLAYCTYNAVVKSVTTKNNLEFFNKSGDGINDILSGMCE